MNRNMIYFLQRVLSAGASALVYAWADYLTEKNKPVRMNQQWKNLEQKTAQPKQKTIHRSIQKPSRSFRDQHLEKK